MSVRIREGKLDELTALYESTLKKLYFQITTATAAGKIQRAKVMARIRYELETLGVDVDAWVKKEIPQYYRDGANDAVRDLRGQGISVEKVPAAINVEAIKALVDETSLAFAESIRAVGRNAQRILDDVIKQQINLTIAEGRLTGQARRTISAAVAQRLRDEGITALTDRAGKRWQLDTYSRMLSRTKAVEARNQGLTNFMLHNGYDLVEVTSSFSTHEVCKRWEGKVLSLTGQAIGRPSLEDAKADGLFHPNCQHAINVYNEELAEKTVGYDPATGEYEGEGFKVSAPFPLNSKERRFMQAERVTVVNRKPGKNVPSGMIGEFSWAPGKQEIAMYRPEHRLAQHYFYHELGHAIEVRSKASAVEALRNNANILREHTNRIAAARLVQATGMNRTEATRRVISSNDSYTRYIKQLDEVFADGYAQWRNNPKVFAERAPELAKLYEEVLNGY